MTELLGGEAYVYCSVVLPAFRLDHVIDITDDDPAYEGKFKSAFQRHGKLLPTRHVSRWPQHWIHFSRMSSKTKEGIGKDSKSPIYQIRLFI